MGVIIPYINMIYMVHVNYTNIVFCVVWDVMLHKTIVAYSSV